jgi:hypothetical protein
MGEWFFFFSFSLGTLLFQRWKPISPMNNELPSNKGSIFFWGNIYFESFSNHNHLVVIYNLSLERYGEELQLCSWKHFNENSHEKVMFTQSFEHNYSIYQGATMFPQGAIPLESNLHRVPLRANVFKTLCEHNFCMCNLIKVLLITKSYLFLRPFQW